MKVGYSFTKNSLMVTFRDISREVPVGSTYHWDFGDSNVAEDDKNPSHTYSLPGFYLVILTITPNGETLPQSYKVVIGVSDKAITTLSDSVYNLIDFILPAGFITPTDYEFTKRIYIEKWQLYIQPLVDHDIPQEEYNNELYYEALENQLIMELAVYDWINAEMLNLMGSLSQYGSSGSSDGGNNGEVKKITTGPTDVEFFSLIDTAYKTLVAAIKKDGIVDVIKNNLCMLSARLSIYIPICSMLPTGVIVPEVANRREPGLLGGPNPTFPIRK